jgi:hypothetical protein
MITEQEYRCFIEKTAKRKFKNNNINWGSWYTQYLYYESMWETYFLDFITEYSILREKPEIKFVFWESCPGGIPFPHPNYAFDSSRYNNNIDGQFDRYLTMVCRNFDINFVEQNEKKKIGEIINILGENGVIIIDLYPTHGINLNTENRNKMFNDVFPFYGIQKLKRIGERLNHLNKNYTIFVTSELFNAGFDDMNPNLANEIRLALGINSENINFEIIN